MLKQQNIQIIRQYIHYVKSQNQCRLKAATHKIRINYIGETSIKREAKLMKDYQTSNIIIALYYCKLLANSQAMITQFS